MDWEWVLSSEASRRGHRNRWLNTKLKECEAQDGTGESEVKKFTATWQASPKLFESFVPNLIKTDQFERKWNRLEAVVFAATHHEVKRRPDGQRVSFGPPAWRVRASSSRAAPVKIFRWKTEARARQIRIVSTGPAKESNRVRRLKRFPNPYRSLSAPDGLLLAKRILNRTTWTGFYWSV